MLLMFLEKFIQNLFNQIMLDTSIKNFVTILNYWKNVKVCQICFMMTEIKQFIWKILIYVNQEEYLDSENDNNLISKKDGDNDTLKKNT